MWFPGGRLGPVVCDTKPLCVRQDNAILKEAQRHAQSG